jgi:ABC-type uncharacterized transport system substrate-binding protein
VGEKGELRSWNTRRASGFELLEATVSTFSMRQGTRQERSGNRKVIIIYCYGNVVLLLLLLLILLLVL